MWELDYKESWVLKNWCFWTVVLEKTLVSPMGCKEIQPVHPKGNQSWIFIWRTDAEAETPILWPSDGKNWLIWKRLWHWERLKTGEGDNREWDGLMASPTWCTWVWASSGNWWRTGKPGVLQSMGSQRVRHDWATELNWLLPLISNWPSLLFGTQGKHRTLKPFSTRNRTWKVFGIQEGPAWFQFNSIHTCCRHGRDPGKLSNF